MKEKVSIPLEEQELHINYSPAMGKNCEIYTTIPWAMKYLDKMIHEYPEQFKLVRDDNYSITATIPFKSVKPRAPRTYTDEQRQALAERLAAAREKKADSSEDE